MWHAFEDGATIGQQGSESGEIARDEEHPLGARITLERDTPIAPFAITWVFTAGWFTPVSSAVRKNQPQHTK